jgi:hypothetical protein
LVLFSPKNALPLVLAIRWTSSYAFSRLPGLLSTRYGRVIKSIFFLSDSLRKAIARSPNGSSILPTTHLVALSCGRLLRSSGLLLSRLVIEILPRAFAH